MHTKLTTHGRRLCGTLVLAFGLSVTGGCAMLPPLIEHGYTVISGLSYLATSKGPSDHALSLLAGKDCSLFRILRGQPICAPVTENTNRPLLVTLREVFDDAPRDLPPAELLKQLPQPVDPIPLDEAIAAAD